VLTAKKGLLDLQLPQDGHPGQPKYGQWLLDVGLGDRTRAQAANPTSPARSTAKNQSHGVASPRHRFPNQSNTVLEEDFVFRVLVVFVLSSVY
jgi:hypothetical protein